MLLDSKAIGRNSSGFFRAASECGLEEILEVDEVGFDEKMNALEDHFVVKMLAQ